MAGRILPTRGVFALGRAAKARRKANQSATFAIGSPEVRHAQQKIIQRRREMEAIKADRDAKAATARAKAAASNTAFLWGWRQAKRGYFNQVAKFNGWRARVREGDVQELTRAEREIRDASAKSIEAQRRVATAAKGEGLRQYKAQLAVVRKHLPNVRRVMELQARDAYADHMIQLSATNGNAPAITSHTLARIPRFNAEQMVEFYGLFARVRKALRKGNYQQALLLTQQINHL